MLGQLASKQQFTSELERKLTRLHRRRVAIERLQAEMDAALQQVTRRYAARLRRRQSAIESLGAELEQFCTQHRDAVFGGPQKTLRTRAGTVGFRSGRPRVLIRDGLHQAQVCTKLRAADLPALIRVEETLDKTAVIQAWKAHRLTPRQLAHCGLRIADPAESFFFDTRTFDAACNGETTPWNAQRR